MVKKQLLDKLKMEMSADESLPLRSGSTQLVFGDGDPDAEILFIGEGPGYWEDQKGIPFVGNAGTLLNRSLQSIKLQRESVYITNVVHHRPPQNRDPLPEEIAAYQSYLDEMIRIISPKVVVTLGRFSMAKFLPTARISSVHGRSFKVKWKDKNVLVVPMYHPAAALRNGAVMTQFRDDFVKLPKYLEEAQNSNVEVREEDKREETQQMTLI